MLLRNGLVEKTRSRRREEKGNPTFFIVAHIRERKRSLLQVKAFCLGWGGGGD